MKDNKNMKEKISALADSELSDFETRRILEEIESNPEFREFWKNIQRTKEILSEEDTEFHDVDLSSSIHAELNKNGSKPLVVSKKVPHYPFKYIAASFIGFCAVIIYSLMPKQEQSFSDFASERIVQAIESPEAMEVLNNSVSEFNVILQDFKSNQEGTLASYRLPSSGETFKVSLYPIQEVNKMGISEAAKISYIQAKKGIYVVSVSGNISADKKNQILQKVNFFADKLN
jgi:hypothetical protein